MAGNFNGPGHMPKMNLPAPYPITSGMPAGTKGGQKTFGDLPGAATNKRSEPIPGQSQMPGLNQSAMND